MNLSKLLDIGCGDNSCTFGSPGGMATNGGCRCFKDVDIVPGMADWSIEKRKGHLDMKTQRNAGISCLRTMADSPAIAAALMAIKDQITARARAETEANEQGKTSMDNSERD